MRLYVLILLSCQPEHEDLENTGSTETEMLIPIKRARTEKKKSQQFLPYLAIIHLEASPISLWT